MAKKLTGLDQLKGKAAQLKNKVAEQLDEVKDAAQDAFDHTKNFVGETIEHQLDFLEDKLADTKDLWRKTTGSMMQQTDEWLDDLKIPEKYQQFILSRLPQVGELAVEALKGKAKKAANLETYLMPAIDKTYELMPLPVRLIISRDDFRAFCLKHLPVIKKFILQFAEKQGLDTQKYPLLLEAAK